MGKSIDLTVPLSDEDRAWLLERGAYDDVRVSDAITGATAAPEEAGPTDSPVEPTTLEVSSDDAPAEPEAAQGEPEANDYTDWTKDQLMYELGQRGLSRAGNKDELTARLESDDADNDPSVAE